jgi:hypothetical protein
MEVMYRWVIFAGTAAALVVLGICFFFFRRKKDVYSGGLKASNTTRIKSTKLYKEITKRFLVLRIVMITGMVGSIIASLMLVSRPYKTQDVVTGVKKRDIIICMDVSYSLYDLNSELTEYLKGVVKGLVGDRIGINIFNTSSVTYVPLTDDYDYVVDKLDELSEYFILQKELYENIYDNYDYLSEMPDDVAARYNELMDRLAYFDAGTLYNNTKRGSSLIGEGLGTALYSFPYLGDSERTRVIIMSTDNQLNAFSGEIMNLSEASDYCKKYKVTVFGIFPSEENFYEPATHSYSGCLNDFKRAVEKTGGKFYVRTQDQSVSDIVQNIQRQEAMIVNMVMTRETTDVPRLPFVILLICFAFACGAGLALQK